MPAAYAGTTQRLVFTWRNDGSVGYQPPAAIDNISITSSNGAPNDDPCNATTINVNNSCSYGAFTNSCATNTTTPGSPGCASYNGADVWYKATVPASGKINFDSNIGTITDGGMAVYSGPCSALTLISCDDDASLNGAMPAINISGQIPGSVVYIRFWAFGAAQSGSFQLCAYDPCPTGPGTCSSLLGAGVTNIVSLPYASGAGSTNGMGDDLTSTNTATCGASYYFGGMDRVWYLHLPFQDQ
ncbi:MAG: hypothetical protein IPO27_12270 [Bacteroidetes bacterium]|nr:hypothetical protein [Bacteroidota bacterium]